MIVTSIENTKVKEWYKLKTRKYREQKGLFLVEGEHLVLEAYRKGYIEYLILEESESFSLDVNAVYVSMDIIKHLSSLETPSTIIAVCKMPIFTGNLGNKLLLIDGIQDPGNLGTIIRSAVAFKVDTIVLGKGTVDIYNEKCIRSTQGMVFNINVINKDLVSFIENIKDDSYVVLGTKGTGGINLKEAPKYEKYALILGNEGNGIDEGILNLCDDILSIKINNNCESLNVGIACSIILYQLNEW